MVGVQARMTRWQQGSPLEAGELRGIAFMVLISVVCVVQAPGTRSKAVTALAMAVAEAGLLIGRHAPARGRGWGLLAAIAASLGAMIVSPDGLGEVPLLVASSRLPRALSQRLRIPVIGSLSVVFAVTVGVISGSLIGLLAGLGVWLLAQRTVSGDALAAERDRAVDLLAQVRASRDAQALAAAGAERERIAREMHDVLAHSLAGLSLQLQAVRAVAVREGVGDAVTVPLLRAAELAREGMVEARAAVGALSAPEALGVEALAGLVGRFGGTSTMLTSGTAAVLPAATGHALYRTTQESLTNAARYAPGSRVVVALDWSPSQLVLTVSDDGPDRSRAQGPVDAGARGGTGSGLPGLAERVRHVGGEFSAGPAGRGWSVRAVVPIPADPTSPGSMMGR